MDLYTSLPNYTRNGGVGGMMIVPYFVFLLVYAERFLRH